jgi:SAM-dependent methyltransferase
MSGDSRPRDFEKRWQKRFAEFARLYNNDAGVAGWSESGLQTRLRFFASLWHGAPRDALYVDVGCGAGTYCRWLADRGLSVVGVDYSPPALLKARQREAHRIAYCAADACRLPFGRAFADGLLCFGVLQAVSTSEPFVREAARVLRKDGEYWVDALNARGLRAMWDLTARRLTGKPMHLRYESPRALKTVVREAGFEKISLHWLLIMPPRLQSLQRLCDSTPVQVLLKTVPFVGSLLSHSFVIRAVRSKPAASSE